MNNITGMSNEPSFDFESKDYNRGNTLTNSNKRK